jgi:hypothetical protein
LDVTSLNAAELALPDEWSGETPLWYYLLKEAEARAGGNQLGPAGSRIVGEVLVGIVQRDPESFLSVDPDWRPTLGADEFGIADEGRAFAVHVTLARKITRLLRYRLSSSIDWPVDRLALVASETGNQGPLYRVLADLPFRSVP